MSGKNEFESISTGVFLVKPGTYKSSKKGAPLPAGCNEKNEYFRPLLGGHETAEQMKLRKQALDSAWNTVLQEVQAIQNRIHQSTLHEICCFIELQQEIFYERLISTLQDDKMSVVHQLSTQLRPEIPTAIVAAGMNVLDHERLLNYCLKDQIERDTGAFVINLSASDCGNVASAIYSIVTQFLRLTNDTKIKSAAEYSDDDDDNDDDDDDDDDETNNDASLFSTYDYYDRIKISRSNCSLKFLVNWYRRNWNSSKHHHHHHIVESDNEDEDEDEEEDDDILNSSDSDDDDNKMKRGSDDDDEEEEGNSDNENGGRKSVNVKKEKKILQEKKRKTVRAMVIVIEDFECFIPQVAQQIVAICSNYIDQIPITFVIGIATTISVIHQMLPRSICSRLLIKKFYFQPSFHQLKEILLNLFIQQQKSVIGLSFQCFQLLFNSFEEANISIEKFTRSLHYVYIEHYYKNPISFMTLLVENDNSKSPKNNNNNHNHRQNVMRHISKLHCQYLQSLPSVRKYVECHEESPQFNNLSVMKETILKWCSSISSYRKRFGVAFECYSMLPYYSPTFKSKLHFLFLLAHHEKPSKRFPILRNSFLLKKLNQVETAITVLKQWEEKIRSSEVGGFQKDLTIIATFIRRIEAERTSNYNTTLSTETFLAIRKFIATFLLKYIRLPDNFPLSEAFFFKNAQRIQTSFYPSIRYSLEHAISNPQFYLGNIEDEETLPDSSRAFQFYREAGRRINLFDWYIQFCGRKNLKHPHQQCRFIRALSELHMFGFINVKNSNMVEKNI